MRIGKYEDWLNKVYNNLDMIFISIKNNEIEKWTFGNMYQISCDALHILKPINQKPATKKTKTKKPFSFSSKGIPLNISTD